MNNEWKQAKDNLVQLLSKGSLPSTTTTASFTPYRPQAPQSYVPKNVYIFLQIC